MPHTQSNKPSNSNGHVSFLLQGPMAHGVPFVDVGTFLHIDNDVTLDPGARPMETHVQNCNVTFPRSGVLPWKQELGILISQNWCFSLFGRCSSQTIQQFHSAGPHERVTPIAFGRDRCLPYGARSYLRRSLPSVFSAGCPQLPVCSPRHP